MRPNERRQTFNKPSTFSPTARAEAEHKAATNGVNIRLTGMGLTGRTPQKMYVCPARAYASHPDAALRKLANEQARDLHMLNDYIEHGTIHEGPCRAKRCKTPRGGLSVQRGKSAKNWDGQYGRTALGKGSFYK